MKLATARSTSPATRPRPALNCGGPNGTPPALCWWTTSPPGSASTAISALHPGGRQALLPRPVDTGGGVQDAVGDGRHRRGHRDAWQATVQVATIGLPPHTLAVLNGVVYFAGYTFDTGTQLWRSDGTPDGTRMLKTIPESYPSVPVELTPFGGRLSISSPTTIRSGPPTARPTAPSIKASTSTSLRWATTSCSAATSSTSPPARWPPG